MEVGPDLKIKIILCGNSGVGKTSFFERCLGKTCHTQSPVSPTIGIDMDVLLFTHKKKQFQVSLWDTAGQEKFMSLSEQFYRGADACLVFTDLSDGPARCWDKRIQQLEEWLKIVRSKVDKECLVVCVGSKMDLCTDSMWVEGVKVGNKDSFPQFMNTVNEDIEDTSKNINSLFTLVESIIITSSLRDPPSYFQNFLLMCCMRKLSRDEISIHTTQSKRTPGQPQVCDNSNSKANREKLDQGISINKTRWFTLTGKCL